jgi:rhodanese-related sulfurtransferase
MARMLTLSALTADPSRYYLIDVRDVDDYAAAHGEGAVHTPLAELGLHSHQIPRDKIAVTICGKGGGRSAEGVDILRKLGQPDALWLEGTNGWLQLSTR